MKTVLNGVVLAKSYDIVTVEGNAYFPMDSWKKENFWSEQVNVTVFVEGQSKLLTRMTWKTKITACKPYTYVDEMSNTVFKRWKHTHVFHKINENQTKVTDEIEFELQYGFIGKMFEWYALDKLKKIFSHRQQATIEYLSDLWTILRCYF